MRRRAWWFVAAAAVVIAAAVVVPLVVLNSGSGGENASLPPLRGGPGSYRIHSEGNVSTNGRNVTYPPNLTVGSTKALVLVRDVHGRGGGAIATMQIWVGQRPTDGSSYAAQHGCDCRRGQRISVGSLQFHILHVWQEPGSAHDAVDLQVSAA